MDNVNSPEHYIKGPECFDVMIIMFGYETTLHFCMCNAFKYIWRYNNKNGQEDLDKARWYIEKARYLSCKFGNYCDSEIQAHNDILIGQLTAAVMDRYKEYENDD